MKTHKLTILTACLNARRTIVRACRSIDAQRLPEDVEVEHLILDGVSSDDTMDCIEAYESKRRQAHAGPRVSRRVVRQSDRGLYDALNSGLSLTDGDLAGILHADDFLASDGVLARIISSFSEPEIDGVYGDLLYVKRQKNGVLAQHRYWRSGRYDGRAMRLGWMPPHPTLYLRRNVYERNGGFRTDFGSAADYEFIVRLLGAGGIALAYIPEILVCMESGGLSNRSVGARWKAHRADWNAWRVNQLTPQWRTLLLKPLRKVSQFWLRQRNFEFPEWASSSES